jgi:hypothetical protein
MTPHIADARRRINAAVLLGIVILSRPGCANVDEMTGILPSGSWGGEHMLLVIGDTIADVEYDCAHGSVRLPIMLDNGAFSALGSYTQERGGPIREGELANPVPARYSGRVTGNRMTVTVTLTSENRTIGTFELTRGSSGRVFKCL